MPSKSILKKSTILWVLIIFSTLAWGAQTKTSAPAPPRLKPAQQAKPAPTPKPPSPKPPPRHVPPPPLRCLASTHSSEYDCYRKLSAARAARKCWSASSQTRAPSFWLSKSVMSNADRREQFWEGR